MAKKKVTYECNACGYVAPSYLGKCPACQSWDSFTEQVVQKESAGLGEGLAKRSSYVKQQSPQRLDEKSVPLPLASIQTDDIQRVSSGFAEMDRVLGGGIVPGGYVLIGGDPGIGKSTLMLQMAERVALAMKKPVLYVAGEESAYQIKLRADRLGLDQQNLLVLAENQIHTVVDTILEQLPGLVIVDSIQSVYSTHLSGTPGSIGQIKECAGLLMEVAKTSGVPVFLVGHVTKEGQVSGPKLLEHTVDTVLYLEGEKYQNLRILRTVKNRFGSTQEIGMFDIDQGGLREITNPSKLFLSRGGHPQEPGSVVVATLEGSRPMLVELQALVGQSAYAVPRRVSNGVDSNRLNQIIAVLERRLGLNFAHQDIYVNVVGGLRVDEPATDLGIALAIITSERNVSLLDGTVLCGEIGLTGEIRPVQHWEKRLNEAQRLGFERMLMPMTDRHVGEVLGDAVMDVQEVSSLMEAITASLPSTSAGRLGIIPSATPVNVPSSQETPS